MINDAPRQFFFGHVYTNKRTERLSAVCALLRMICCATHKIHSVPVVVWVMTISSCQGLIVATRLEWPCCSFSDTSGTRTVQKTALGPLLLRRINLRTTTRNSAKTKRTTAYLVPTRHNLCSCCAPEDNRTICVILTGRSSQNKACDCSCHLILIDLSKNKNCNCY